MTDRQFTPHNPGEESLTVDPVTGYPQGYGFAQEAQKQSVADGPPAPVGNMYDELNNLIPKAILDGTAGQGGDVANESFYPEGLTPEMVAGWKERYGQTNIYLTSILDRIWVTRSVARIEWVHLKSQSFTEDMFKDILATRCVLFPILSKKTIEAIPGGLPESLYDQISYCSGFNTQSIPIRL